MTEIKYGSIEFQITIISNLYRRVFQEMQIFCSRTYARRFNSRCNTLRIYCVPPAVHAGVPHSRNEKINDLKHTYHSSPTNALPADTNMIAIIRKPHPIGTNLRF